MKKEASTWAYVYLIFVVATLVFLSWRLIDTKLIFHAPKFQNINLLKSQSGPVWEASDSASFADSQTKLTEQLTAQAYLVMDIDSRTILVEKNSQIPLPPASTTKLMTALVALEAYDLNDVLEISSMAAEENDGGGLFPHEQLTVRDLLTGMLISSANDSAYALAENFPGGEETFVTRMNKNSQELNLASTVFRNPAGYDEPPNVSSARDLSVLMLEIINHPAIMERLSLDRAVVYNTNRTIRHFLFTTNELLGRDPRVVAGKTGTTPLAGEVLISLAEQAGRRLLIVTMGSQDRYADTVLLLNWLEQNFKWKN